MFTNMLLILLIVACAVTALSVARWRAESSRALDSLLTLLKQSDARSHADLVEITASIQSVVENVKDSESRILEECRSIRTGVVGELHTATQKIGANSGALNDQLNQITSLVASLIPNKPVLNFAPKEWAIGTPERPLIRFSRAPVAPDGDDTPHRAMVPQALGSHLSSILQSVPGLASSIDGITRLRVVFTPETTAKLHAHALDLVQSGREWLPMAADPSTGKFVEIGRLVSGISPASVTAVAWQVATMITAQHHLANISTELRGIRDEIESIKLFLYSKEIGSLAADQEYIDQIGRSIAIGSVRMEDATLYHQNLEHIERNTLGIGRAALHRMSDTESKLRARTKFTEKGADKTKYQELAQSFQEDCGIAIASLYVRTMSAYTANLLDSEGKMSKLRLDDVRSQVTQLEAQCQAFADDMTALAPRGGTMVSFWRETCNSFLSWIGEDVSDRSTIGTDFVAKRLKGGLHAKIAHLENLHEKIVASQSSPQAITIDVSYDPSDNQIIDAKYAVTSTELDFPLVRADQD
jgi:hypothetical protein